MFCGSNETVYGIWNTVAGGNSTAASVGTTAGTYYTGETPMNACDDNFGTVYTNFGACTSTTYLTTCGTKTGFYRTPSRGASLVFGFQVCTGGGLNVRDPMTVTLEGSNQPSAALVLGSSWTLIYSGTSGLDNDPGRTACGPPQLFQNSVWYKSYRFLVTSKRGVDSSTWYKEVMLIAY